MSKYKKVKLGSIASINTLSITTKDNITNIKYLDTSNLIKNKIRDFKYFDLKVDSLPSRAKRKVKENTILYSTVRPNQCHFGILKGLDYPNILVSTGFVTIDVNEEYADPDFIYHYITSDVQIEKMQSIAEQSTTSYPSITPDDIKNISIELPCKNIQRRIGKLLSDIEQKLKLNEQINDNLAYSEIVA